MTRVIIVGSGLAGLSAASTLTTLRIPVLLLDRADKPGGNSLKASSGINAAPTRFQPLSDSTAQFYADSLKSAGQVFQSASGASRARRETLLSTLTNSSSDAVYWLSDGQGVDLSKVAQLGGHSCPRTHRGDGGGKPPGAAIIGSLLTKLKESPLFELRTGATVVKVLKEANEVMGVEYVSVPEGEGERRETVSGPVVFATGGFAGDIHGLMAQYRPDLTGIPSTNEAREGSQPLLEAVGAALVDMDQVQVHPTGFVDLTSVDAPVKFLAAEALRGEGGILLLKNGKRFVNELETREHVTHTIMHSATRMQSAPRQWEVNLLLDEGAAEALSSHMQFYLWKGLMKKTTLGELGETTLQTVREYADVVAGKQADVYGRTAFGNWALEDVQPDSIAYVGSVTPVLHFTMGGVVFNEHAQVLDAAGEPIMGLWAAGEVTGGLHGQNRLGGSSLLECAVFGRIAGEQAASFYQQHYPVL